MSAELKLADLVVDCADAEQLCAFYQSLLGWKRGDLFGHPAVISEKIKKDPCSNRDLFILEENRKKKVQSKPSGKEPPII